MFCHILYRIFSSVSLSVEYVNFILLGWVEAAPFAGLASRLIADITYLY